ncbi:MAG TPA: hypothetical protein DCM05_10670 [Elusimicrobia bacterium]|nr:hypothetical protein [Elusimicrobiota bacterium]
MLRALLLAGLALPAAAADPMAEREIQLGQANAQASRLIEDVETLLMRLDGARKRYEQGGGGAKAFDAWEAERGQVLRQLSPRLDSLHKARSSLGELRETAAMSYLFRFAGGLKSKDGSALHTAPRFVEHIQVQPIERAADECLKKAQVAREDDMEAFVAEGARLSAQRKLYGRLVLLSVLSGAVLLGWAWRRSTRAGLRASPGTS